MYKVMIKSMYAGMPVSGWVYTDSHGYDYTQDEVEAGSYSPSQVGMILVWLERDRDYANHVVTLVRV